MRQKLFYLNLILVILQVQPISSLCAQAGNVTAFVHVNLVPMTAETILPDQTVLVEGSRIIAIGPSNRVDVPENSAIIKNSNSNRVRATHLTKYDILF